jgi:hypothetical protein
MGQIAEPATPPMSPQTPKVFPRGTEYTEYTDDIFKKPYAEETQGTLKPCAATQGRLKRKQTDNSSHGEVIPTKLFTKKIRLDPVQVPAPLYRIVIKHGACSTWVDTCSYIPPKLHDPQTSSVPTLKTVEGEKLVT